jgi:hypothetical protein
MSPSRLKAAKWFNDNIAPKISREYLKKAKQRISQKDVSHELNQVEKYLQRAGVWTYP